MKGYYSLIQFCPNSSRLEAVNLGVVLLCPEAKYLAVRIAKSNSRAAKLVGHKELDGPSLNSAKRAIERRLETDRASFQTVEDLQRFIDTRANSLRMTAARPIRVQDPKLLLDSLFEELVGGVPRSSQPKLFYRELDSVFKQLSGEGKAQLNMEVRVPLINKQLRFPYSYQNGVLNLVKPHRFTSGEQHSLTTAMRFALEGDIISKEGVELSTNRKPKAQLVIITSFASKALEGDLGMRIDDIFRRYHVKSVPDSKATEFADQVRKEAH